MEQRELFLRAVEILERLEIRYMVTGSFAVNFYGIPRTTHDIDLIVEIQPSDAERLASAFPNDFYADPETARNAIAQELMFNFIDWSSGLKAVFGSCNASHLIITT